MQAKCSIPNLILALLVFYLPVSGQQPPKKTMSYPTEIKKITYHSAADETEQPALFWMPEKSDKAVPLLVALHTWSGDYQQTSSQVSMAKWCIRENWAFIHPNFRGPNWTPDALGSSLAVEDIISAVKYAKKQANIDTNRIYCIGVSGGGHASMLMAARAPKIWAGVSAWCGISDIETWHHQCENSPFSRYATHIEKALGHRPENSEATKLRSPNYWLAKNRDSLPTLDIWHGLHDGRRGSVPFTHSLQAWNHSVPQAQQIPQTDIDSFYQSQQPPPPVTPFKKVENRDVLFQKNTGNIRVSIFDGGHEILQEAALNWLAAQKKDAAPVWQPSVYKKLDRTTKDTESGK